nr:immunoglobulin heavy chain junction region [Macaca mulatta]MOX91553.1 immunoglobulin heavy chain junction region [Macaca mulatta]MOX91592.1 immunoglobulin heavy chain junction region [Macaca mulatta]MOX91702.1 immunoglobulin heavy chain junction region [Macaca mulatta]MOX91721.1 immunoglobulin heavy chain junction region [Macaca mulatta]
CVRDVYGSGYDYW